ncbi:DUF418 domain-containing protein [Nonomuraea sp. LPB2021202275-12-8]|uniref:DUF418 domain-containing protein n=1 Tax=Nonomuraea sp. LPB2021202275-12-8 TaxID=3120159 RepID=UPI00300D6D24
MTTPPLQLGPAAAVFATQVLYSRWWLRGHRYGPVEWLLRSLTYRRVQEGRARKPPESST